MDAKKVVVEVSMSDDKTKQKVMKAISTISGVDSLAVDMKAQTITVIGAIDPVKVVGKIPKKFSATLQIVGPAKEPEKKNGKTEEPKKEGEGKKDGDNKKGENGKKKENDPAMELIKACRELNYPCMGTTHYCVHVQEDPYPCSIM